MDGCLVAAYLPGDLVFAIASERFGFLKYGIDVLPIDPARPASIRAKVRAVRGQSRLAIFREGRITVTGGLMKIYDGPGIIADKANADVTPPMSTACSFTRRH